MELYFFTAARFAARAIKSWKMHREIRETQLPEQTRDIICINFAGKVIRLEAYRRQGEWFSKFSRFTNRLCVNINSNVKIRELGNTGGIFRGDSRDILSTADFSTPRSNWSKQGWKEAFRESPYRYYAYFTILLNFIARFSAGQFGAPPEARVSKAFTIYSELERDNMLK